jgi:hypothetical protein
MAATAARSAPQPLLSDELIVLESTSQSKEEVIQETPADRVHIW